MEEEIRRFYVHDLMQILIQKKELVHFYKT